MDAEGSAVPKTADTTATPAAPAWRADAALPAFTPPMATTGMLTAAQMAARVSRLMTLESFVDVGNTALAWRVPSALTPSS